MNDPVLPGRGDMGFGAGVEMNTLGKMRVAMKQHWHFECFDKDGKLKWEEHVDNIVVDVGLDEMLQRIYKSSGFTASDFVGLKAVGVPVAGDTMGSHASWALAVPYSNATRPAFTPGAVASQSVDNSASKAVFNINASLTVAGGFLTDSSTKSGTTGILLGVADFAASRAVENGDTLNVSVTCTQASV